MGWRKGDVIMASEPYAHVLSNKFRKERCSFCFQRQLELKKCSACSILWYCDRNCQKQDWNIHKKECKCLQRVVPNTPTDSVLLMLRLIIKFKHGEHKKRAENDPGLKTFEQLMSHSEDIKGDVSRCDAFSKICFTLSRLTGRELQLPDTAHLLDIFGKMVINTFTIADEELNNIGAGIYLSPSCLDHCCTPNAVITFQGNSLYVRALDDIPHGELSQVSDVVYLSYVDQLAPSWERQEQLQQQYYFTCKCPRCQDTELDRMMTQGLQVETSDDSGCKENDTAVIAAIKACKDVLAKVDKIKESSEGGDILTLCQECLSKTGKLLSTSNVYKIRLLDHAFDAAISSQLWEEALGYGLQTLQPYQDLLPPYSPHLGLQLLRVGKLQLWLDQIQDARNNLLQAEIIVAVTHGTDSELYSQVMDLLAQTEVAATRRPLDAIEMT